MTSLEPRTLRMLLLGATSVMSGRMMLLSIDDPEGPNLLIVMVFGAIIFVISLGAYRSLHRFGNTIGLIAVVAIQALVVLLCYW